MTINELVRTDEWIDVEHERVIVRGIGGTVYYDGGDLQVDPFDFDEYEVPEWAMRPIIMRGHIKSSVEDVDNEVRITIA